MARLKIAEKSIVSDFKLWIKVICVCLLIPPEAISLYDLFFMGGRMVFPVLGVGTVIWAVICAVYLIIMMFSETLRDISIKEGISFRSIRRKIMLLIGIFAVVAVVFSWLAVMDYKTTSSWQKEIKKVEEMMMQSDNEH